MKESVPSERAVRREQYEKDMRWLMGDPRGRRLMMKLLSDIGMYRCTYDAGMKDIQSEMLFREGQKNVGYRLMSEINSICPSTYFLMIKENNNG